jgi:RNA polymerase sigma-70 factor (ECF subfamily)
MSDLSLHTEQQLLSALRDGSEAAYEEIFRRFWTPCYNIARTKVQAHAEAEEIVQAIFFALWEKRATLYVTNLWYYLQTSVRNRVIDHIRQQITQRKYWDYYKAFFPWQRTETEDTVEYDNLHEALEEAVSHLPEKSRVVFRLNRLEGRSVAEIAGLLQLSEKAIEYHLTKSLKQLRYRLRDFIFLTAMLACL